MAFIELITRARALKAAGHEAGYHHAHGVVVLLEGQVWRVVGGNVEAPTLQRRAEIPRGEVHWL